MISFSSFTSSKRPGATVAGIVGVAMACLFLFCGAGSVPIENFSPQGSMQADLNAGAHNITNAASVSAAAFSGNGAGLTNLNGTNLTTGTVSTNALSTPVQPYSANTTTQGNASMTGGVYRSGTASTDSPMTSAEVQAIVGSDIYATLAGPNDFSGGNTFASGSSVEFQSGSSLSFDAGSTSTNGQQLWVATCYDNALSRGMWKTSSDGITWRYYDTQRGFCPAGETDAQPLSNLYYNGQWWIAYATGASDVSSYCGIASSPVPLMNNFAEQAHIDASSLSSTAVWPSCFFQEPWSQSYTTIHVFAGTSPNWPTDTGFYVIESHPTNAQLTAWSTPVALTVASGSWPADMIDPYIYDIGTSGSPSYVMLFKNEGAGYKHIGLATNTTGSITSGWVVVDDGTTDALGLGAAEGPKIVPLGGGVYRIYADNFAVGTESYVQTSNWSTFTSVNTTTDLGFPYASHTTPRLITDAAQIQSIHTAINTSGYDGPVTAGTYEAEYLYTSPPIGYGLRSWNPLASGATYGLLLDTDYASSSTASATTYSGVRYAGSSGSTLSGVSMAPYEIDLWNNHSAPILFGLDNAEVGGWQTTGDFTVGTSDLGIYTGAKSITITAPTYSEFVLNTTGASSGQKTFSFEHDNSGNAQFAFSADTGIGGEIAFDFLGWSSTAPGSVTINGTLLHAPPITSSGAVTATSFSGSGSGLTSNTVPVASLNATGTASSSTFLRGDGAWVGAPVVIASGTATLTAGTVTVSAPNVTATSYCEASVTGSSISVNAGPIYPSRISPGASGTVTFTCINSVSADTITWKVLQ